MQTSVIQRIFEYINTVMNTIVLKSGMSLKTEDGEIINVRVYDDGWVKLENINMRKDFTDLSTAKNFIERMRMKVA